LLEEGSAKKSIPVLLGKDTVGNSKVCGTRERRV